MDINNLIPRHKLDFENVNKIKECDKNSIRLIMPELFEWLRDVNWPIASEISDILLLFDVELIPYIRMVLNSKDAMWKYTILTRIVNRIDLSASDQLIEDLVRLSNYPKPYDVEEGIDELSKELLQSIKLK